jgi:hypothetical protein
LRGILTKDNEVSCWDDKITENLLVMVISSNKNELKV